MKKKLTTFQVVEGDPNLVTKDELHYSENSAGQVNISKRNIYGELESITYNKDLYVREDVPVGNIYSSSSEEFDTALYTLFNNANESNEGFVQIPKSTYNKEFEVLASYLPSIDEVLYKQCNITGHLGFKDGFDEWSGHQVIQVILWYVESAQPTMWLLNVQRYDFSEYLYVHIKNMQIPDAIGPA